MCRRPGLYVHVPFCKGKCPYCDFFSIDAQNGVEKYLDDLRVEMELYPGFKGTFDSLYVGGGTPSLLTPKQLTRLFDTLHLKLLSYASAGEVEITVELNPADVNERLLECLQEASVTRLSLGVQSFEDSQLRLLGRRHDRASAIRAIEMIRKADFATLGLDLIYNLPDSKPTDWRKNLEQALFFSPEHLSCYSLTVSPDTPFGRMLSQGQFVLSSDDQCAAQYLLGCESCQKVGYDHYEVSNFARRTAYRSRHNQKYWQRTPYLGLGPAAHSFDGVKRFWNTTNLEEYHRTLHAGLCPHAGSEIVDQDRAFIETIALGMRTSRGVELGLVASRPAAQRSIQDLLREELVAISQDRLCPTTRGMLFADGITRLLI